MIEDDMARVLSGRVRGTNNYAEMMAVYEALKAIDSDEHDIIILSDSAHVCNSINKWLSGWIKKSKQVR